MNRLKFRGWDKRMKDWYFYNEDLTSLVPELAEIRDKGLKEDIVFLQYTGLKDKNGKEIYEGDILQFSDKWEWHRGKFAGGILATAKDVEEVSLDHEKYPYERRKIEMPDCYEWILLSELKQYWEVIGNIYENKDLLK